MPGSVGDPVCLDPWNNIVEVHWPQDDWWILLSAFGGGGATQSENCSVSTGPNPVGTIAVFVTDHFIQHSGRDPGTDFEITNRENPAIHKTGRFTGLPVVREDQTSDPWEWAGPQSIPSIENPQTLNAGGMNVNFLFYAKKLSNDRCYHNPAFPSIKFKRADDEGPQLNMQMSVDASAAVFTENGSGDIYRAKTMGPEFPGQLILRKDPPPPEE